jgi:hypothetical protein
MKPFYFKAIEGTNAPRSVQCKRKKEGEREEAWLRKKMRHANKKAGERQENGTIRNSVVCWELGGHVWSCNNVPRQNSIN